MTKKVLEISVRADLGGGPKHLLDLLTYNKSDIELYSAIPFGYDYSDEIIKNSKGSINIPHRKFSIISFIKLLSFCRKNKIKTIHSHGRGAGYYSRLMKVFGFRVIHTLHGVHIEDGLVNKIKLWIDQLLKPLTDLFICVSEGEKNKAIEFKVVNKSNLKVVFNGVNPQKIEHISSKVPKVAMLGRLSYPKGYDILINYIEELSKTQPNLEYYINIAGDGENNAELREQLNKTKFAKKRIKFVGSTKDPINFLKSHTHFLSFSRFEGMPISLLEAISLGLPCMVSNVVGNNDVISLETGYLFTLTSQEEFQQNFIKFLQNQDNQRQEAAYKMVNDQFNIKITTSLLIDLYKNE